jgi:E3 ubiquitin-protein ligase MYCBP2
VEQRRPLPKAGDPADEDRVATLAMQKMTFFECSQCKEPYYGGEVECAGAQEEDEDDLDDDVQAALAMELVCRGCASKGQLQCPEHGTEFLGWKCRYCCEREAHYFCFGTTHFCYVCHDLWQTGVEQRRKLQAGKPCLGKDRCIFGDRHPPGCRNGRDEYALGCTICAQDTECGVLVGSRDRKATRRKLHKSCVLT